MLCRRQVRVCSRCDHGQIYCSGECGRANRSASIREASRRYQKTPKGASNHARREKSRRARQQSTVTHQGSPQEAAVREDHEMASVAVTATAPAVAEVVDEGFQDMEANLLVDMPLGEARGPISSWRSESHHQCDFCGRYCGNLSRVDFLQRRWT